LQLKIDTGEAVQESGGIAATGAGNTAQHKTPAFDSTAQWMDDDAFASAAAGYRNRISTSQVRFVRAECMVDTLEGPVKAGVGDAVVTGVDGEQWPVRHAAFVAKYDPASGTAAGHDGAYVSRPQAVRACRAEVAFSVPLSDGRGVLKGQPGDWLVEYAPGDRSVVGAAIFAKTYCAAIDDAPLVIGLAAPVSAAMRDAVRRLAQALPHTTTVLLCAAADGIDASFYSTATTRFHPLPRAHVALPPLAGIDADIAGRQAAYLSHHCFLVLQGGDAAPSTRARALPYWTPPAHALDCPGRPDAMFGLPAPAPLLTLAAATDLAARLEARGTKPPAEWAGFGRFLLGLFRLHATEAPVPTLYSQLCELDDFNGEPATAAPVTDASPPSRLGSLHARADALASAYQDRWQRLVFSTTRTLATGRAPDGALREFMRRLLSLSGCGVIAAMAFAGYTELSGGCEANDWFAPIGCANAAWRHWAGPLLVGVYVGVLLLALFRYTDAKAREFERKHQDYRLLAECLRVQHLWASSGITQLVADSLPPHGPGDATWVVPSVRALGMLFGDEVRLDRASTLALQGEFVSGQLEYHEKTMLTRREAACAYLNNRAARARVVFVVCVAALCLNTLAEAFLHLGLEGMAHHALVLLTIGALTYWAGNKKILGNFGLESEIKRARLLQSALQNAADLIAVPAADDAAFARQREVIVGLGVLFAVDQANWHAVHRERPIEAVTGG
jgi:hypothetical protein